MARLALTKYALSLSIPLNQMANERTNKKTDGVLLWDKILTKYRMNKTQTAKSKVSYKNKAYSRIIHIAHNLITRCIYSIYSSPRTTVERP